MKLSEHIDLRELVSSGVYLLRGDSAVSLIDSRLPIILERIRELCGNRTMTLNDWHIGGRFQLRGYRPPGSTVGATKSMHKLGKAADFTIKGMSAEGVRGVIRLNQVELMKLGLTRIERGVSWVHIDLKHTGLDTIYEFNP